MKKSAACHRNRIDGSHARRLAVPILGMAHGTKPVVVSVWSVLAGPWRGAQARLSPSVRVRIWTSESKRVKMVVLLTYGDLPCVGILSLHLVY
jgi:hypothetical protein